MHQQQQQDGGSHYGAPPSQLSPLPPSAVGARPQLLGVPTSDHIPQLLPEAAAPISIRSPARPMYFDELAPAVAGNFPDDDAVTGGEDAERGGGAAGNRWPREETLALLKVRSEMDAAFRDATLKSPLWEEVSRKLAEQGYRRSGKKCKEKFENVHKYYKRTKESRAGRQDGKSYRFFSELEALYSGSGYTSIPASATTNFSGSGTVGPPASRAQLISAVAPPTMVTPTRVVVPDSTPSGGTKGISSSAGAAMAGILLSPVSSSSPSTSDSEGEEPEEAGARQEGKTRKRGGGSSGPRKKMTVFFNRLMGQVLERQEAMQQRFLEAIEKREQDRMIRDEAWRRQEMARLSREQELLAQERANAASRDTTIITYLQKISGQPIQISSPIPTVPATPIRISPQPPASVPTQQPLQPPPGPAPPPSQQIPQLAREHIPISEALEATGGSGLETVSSSSRWPKAEVHALINLRSELDTKSQESGSKGTLWEEISVGMQRLGYNRSAKRCKEKWENINKYFKKVKESSKKRLEDSKTCPYFHQLDALYRNKLLIGSSGIASDQQEEQQLQAPPPQEQQQQTAAEAESNGKNSSNGGLLPSFFNEGSKKELMGQEMNESDEADSMEQDYDDDDDEEENEERKLQYKVQVHRHNTVNTSGRGTPPVAAAAGAATTAGSFWAIVQ